MSGDQLSVISEDVVASINREISGVVTTILPTILQEVIPNIMLTELPKILVNIMEETKRIEAAKNDAKDYMDSNPEKFNIGYKKRNKLFEGYWRCVSLTKLYEECKQKSQQSSPLRKGVNNFDGGQMNL